MITTTVRSLYNAAELLLDEKLTTVEHSVVALFGEGFLVLCDVEYIKLDDVVDYDPATGRAVLRSYSARGTVRGDRLVVSFVKTVPVEVA